MLTNSIFEKIKYSENNLEFWYARELQEILQYKEWRNFHKVIETAKIACKISQMNVLDCFVEVNKPIISGKGRTQNVLNYKLNRYACYLIVMNGDPRKEVIAQGQSYFAVKTRQQELSELFHTLTEEEKRLFIRGDIKQKNMMLAEVARNAGIITNFEFAIFQDHGYKGLYGGMSAKDIANKKKLSNNEEILDYMGSEELAANLFRITQTEGLIKKENVSTPQNANQTHYTVGKMIRETIEKIGGTLPEELHTPDKSMKQLEKEKKNEISKK